jgi:hypothetical protein
MAWNEALGHRPLAGAAPAVSSARRNSVRNGLLKTSLLALLTTLALPAAASDWQRYGNARFQYWIDVPPGFSKVEEADNGDGGLASSADGAAELRVWGSYPTAGSLAAEAKERQALDRRGGWSISYQAQNKSGAAWSGTKGNRVVYARAIPGCDRAVAYFRIEYDRERQKAFDPVVSRLVKSFRSGDCRAR